MSETTTQEKEEIRLSGIPASPGIVIGTILQVGFSTETEVPKKIIDLQNIDNEIRNFHQALTTTKNQIIELQAKLQGPATSEEKQIFDAHLLMIDDHSIISKVEQLIKTERYSATYAFYTIYQDHLNKLQSIKDPYIRERVSDLRDVSLRMLTNLRNGVIAGLTRLPGLRILVAHDVLPSDTLTLDHDNTQAFATETGSQTSHTAILARSLKIPAIVGINGLTKLVDDGDLMIIDGFSGTVIINPTRESLLEYAQKEAQNEQYYASLKENTQLHAETIDGYRVHLAINLEMLNEIEENLPHEADGVGLFRTEFMFINAKEIPSVETQYHEYSQLAQKMKNKPVIIRTLDVGGDKLSKLLLSPNEANPFLGLRAIRLCLAKTDLFRTQLQAILRASAMGNIRIMIPMITCTEEVVQVKKIIEEEKGRLRKANIPFNEHIELGIMIETPAAALITPKLAELVDFFSIGTNDLIQYTMAVDRANERVAYLYQPTHPAILKSIQQIINIAHDAGIWVGICGEMGGNVHYIPYLVGMGVDELSMSPIYLNISKKLIRSIRKTETEELVKKAINVKTAEESLAIVNEYLSKVSPEIAQLCGPSKL